MDDDSDRDSDGDAAAFSPEMKFLLRARACVHKQHTLVASFDDDKDCTVAAAMRVQFPLPRCGMCRQSVPYMKEC